MMRRNKRDNNGFAVVVVFAFLLLAQVLLLGVVVDAQSCDFFYTITFRNDQYYLSTFNVKTATAAEIGVMGGRKLDVGKSLTIDPTTGKLYGLVGALSNNIKVAEIDKTTGRILSRLPTGVAYGGPVGGSAIAVNSAGRMILGVSDRSNDGNRIYSVNKRTGATSLLGTFGLDQINDVAFDPEGPDNVLYFLGTNLGWFTGNLNDIDRSTLNRLSSFTLEGKDKNTPPFKTLLFAGFDYVAPGQMYVVAGMLWDPMYHAPVFPMERRPPGSRLPTIRLPVYSTLQYPVGCAFECDKTDSAF